MPSSRFVRRRLGLPFARGISACLAVVGSTVLPCRSAGQELELELSWAVPLRDSLPVTGVAHSPSGALLVWGASPPHLALYRRGDWLPILPPGLQRPIAAAFVSGDSIVEVVDAATETVFRVSERGDVLSRREVRGSIDLEAGAHGAEGWYLAGRNDRGEYWLALLSESGTARNLHRLAAPSSDSVGRTAGYLAPSAAGVVFSSIREPFDVIAMSGSDQRHSSFRSVTPGLPDADSAARWVSLAVLPLDRGFLRTFVDLRSDARMIVLHDADGTVIRESRIAVPLGFVASDPGARLLVGLRRTDVLEVVGYRWRRLGVPPQEKIR